MKNKTPKLPNVAFLFIMLVSIKLVSCSDSTSNQPANAEGFTVMENELKNKFGDNAYYTDLKILYIKGLGNTISTTVTQEPESLKMGEWDLSQDTWTQRSEVTLEVPEGTKAADFMFQLSNKVKLTKLGGLVEESITKLTTEKNIDNPILSMAFVKFPKNGDISKTEYAVRLEPENGGTSFTYYYTLNGELIKMDY
ncbi:hypothetical protein [uncultured Psychroserpens sp.]|uniref:hypothetical protein n=1 Tax=uncultured Psychroserpens sp. TaxID=255436 RepID=UPI00260C5111|nr:hypothetical protein [uncultured Psychroserpens sp.]